MLSNRKLENLGVSVLLCATVALASAWVLEPALVGSNLLWRLLLAGGCLATMAAMFQLELRRQKRDERAARRSIDTLCRLDYRDLAAADETQFPARFDQHNGWAPVFCRVREHLVQCGQRVEEAEQAWTGTEVRMRRLSQQHDQLCEILDHLCDSIVAVNQYDELILANAGARQLLAITGSHGDGQSLAQQIANQALVHQLIDTRRRRAPTPRVSELQLTDSQGQQRWLRVSCRALVLDEDNQSEGHGAVAVLIDISQEKGIQKRHAEFVSAASHEMKTPLTGIRAYTELLLDGEAEDAETREQFLEVIDTQAQRLQRLIENLLNLARIEAGVVEVNKEMQSLNELLEKAFNVVQPAAEQKRIRLVRDLSPMYLGVLADHDMIMQAAINLLSNAVKYTAEGGKVSLRSRMEENAAVFEVEDTGVGLSEEDCQKVFEKFYRVKKDQNMAGGTGLGLPLARHIVEDVHAGKLTLTSQLGKGSVFRVSLPVLTRAKI